jgi:hypothetical protein
MRSKSVHSLSLSVSLPASLSERWGEEAKHLYRGLHVCGAQQTDVAVQHAAQRFDHLLTHVRRWVFQPLHHAPRSRVIGGVGGEATENVN